MDQKKDVNLKRCPHIHWLKYSKVMQAIAEVCCLCNESRIDARDGVFRAVGAPTEAALVVLAEKTGRARPRSTRAHSCTARLQTPSVMLTELHSTMLHGVDAASEIALGLSFAWDGT